MLLFLIYPLLPVLPVDDGGGFCLMGRLTLGNVGNMFTFNSLASKLVSLLEYPSYSSVTTSQSHRRLCRRHCLRRVSYQQKEDDVWCPKHPRYTVNGTFYNRGPPPLLSLFFLLEPPTVEEASMTRLGFRVWPRTFRNVRGYSEPNFVGPDFYQRYFMLHEKHKFQCNRR